MFKGRNLLTLRDFTPDEIRASSDPFVHQFVNAEADGPVPFHYPAPPIDSLLDVRLP